jgi:hypothetical protein
MSVNLVDPIHRKILDSVVFVGSVVLGLALLVVIVVVLIGVSPQTQNVN